MTRTFVRYFSENDENIRRLRSAFRELDADWHGRRKWIDRDVREQGDERLQLLETAIKLLTERVAE